MKENTMNRTSSPGNVQPSVEMPTRTRTSRSRRRNRVARVAASLMLFVGTVTVVQASPAAAYVPDHELVVETSVPNSNTTRSITAECPPGKDLIGMSGSVLGGLGNVFLEGIVPDLIDDTVEVFGHESLAGTTSTWSVRATAVCADEGVISGRYLVEQQESAATGVPSAGAFADCDEGDRALSAGFQVSGAPGRLHLTTLLPTEDTVLAVAQEDAVGTNAAWDVKAIVMCAPLFDSQVYWDEVGSASTSRSKSQSAVCPNDFNVTGGGGYFYDESGATGDLALYSINLGSYGGQHFSVASGVEAAPATLANSTVYTYVVCADLR
jgi:hypothetical protein